jgi:hypothetical protein
LVPAVERIPAGNKIPFVSQVFGDMQHLNLWEIQQKQPRPSPSRAGPLLPVWKRRSVPENPRQQELFDDGWPGFEEPYITYD